MRNQIQLLPEVHTHVGVRWNLDVQEGQSSVVSQFKVWLSIQGVMPSLRSIWREVLGLGSAGAVHAG